MYYHCRPLKYVTYGKVQPPPEDTLDWMLPAYKWLANYCMYCPQIWLSRSTSQITGYRSSNIVKKRKFVKAKRSETKLSNDSVLFGFENIKGFPLSYEPWCLIMNNLLDSSGLATQNKAIVEGLNGLVDMYKEENEEVDGDLVDWVKSGCDLEKYLNEYVFKEIDQVVVPSLNLKSAKKIICRNEKQKKKLRKIGFIEDRILIKNLAVSSW